MYLDIYTCKYVCACVKSEGQKSQLIYLIE